MLVSDVAKLPVKERFIYWIRERHQIYSRRELGYNPPWTDDEVLQTWFFTNPFRENDRTTVWFSEFIRGPLFDSPDVLFATVAFRWFNRIETGQVLIDNGLLRKWDEAKAVRLLQRANQTAPVFTGAYMIKAGNGPPGCKIPNVCAAITNVWRDRKRLLQVVADDCRLEALWAQLKQFPHLGGFMSYEIVSDLRHTALLCNASDINTWCYLGPGAMRGISRLMGMELPNKGGDVVNRGAAKGLTQGLALGTARTLLGYTRRKLRQLAKWIEMREIEHSLCEFDKYERARLGQGKMKRRYTPKP